MPIDFPDYDIIIARILADVEGALPGIDPTIHGSFENAFSIGLGGRAFDNVELLKQLLKEMFPQTASGVYLERFAGYNDLTRIVATSATGKVTFTGTISSVVPISTQIKSTSTGETYTTDAEITLAAQSISVTSLTRSGTIATAVTASDHKIASGMSITIAGANETDYNGTFTVTVTGTDSFEYTVSGSPSTPATGTITAAFDGEEVSITSVDTGEDVNLDSGAQLNLITPISGIDTTSLVQYSEITGGKDVESDDALILRVLYARANPVANFNVAAIEKQCFLISGVTRVKVKRITPAAGQVTILFVRDDDIGGIIPDSSEVTAVKISITKILPATSATADVIVTAPTAVTTNFTFTALSPDTATMRTAIQNSLKAFYRDNVAFEIDVTEDNYRNAIVSTIDPATGDIVNSFTLSAPSGDITVTTNEIGVLGTVSFP
jgi:uncharacterized phage protein gp47/JayE